MKPACLAFAALAAGVVACSGRAPAPQDPVQGAWRVVTMHLVSSDGGIVEVPAHESLILFADGYYSIGYAFGDGSVPYAERWHPSDSEKVARFGSMIVNSGSYRVSGSRIDARPLFAVAPEFVGGQGVFSYAFAADTLVLTWERSLASDGLEYPTRGTVTRLRLVRAR